MAPSAVNDDSQSAALDNIAKPPADVVQPPKDIKAILEKTAGYCQRNGINFEERIREANKTNPKFSFLNPGDAYHSYFVWRKAEIGEGRGTDVSAGRVGESAAQVEEAPKGPEPPQEFQFSARMPLINAQDLEIIKLTALFAAKNGRTFVTTLAQRESTNYQFDFLRPQHSLYQFFTRLTDQYSELLNARGSDGGKAEQTRIEELTKNVEDKLHLLDRSKHRAEWVKFQAKQKKQEEEEAETEKLAYAQIDWHDFTVVETVLFTEADDEAALPPPTSIGDLQSASLEQKAMMSAPHNMRIEEAMPTDGDVYYNEYGQQTAQQQYQPQPPQQNYQASPAPIPAQSYPGQPAAPAVQMPFPPQPQSGAPVPAATQAYPNDNRIERPNAAQAPGRGAAGAPMNIRTDYVPRAQAARGQQQAVTICPNCSQPVPYAEFQEHVRIEMLDPRWKEQRAKADARYATTNLSTADVANNLKRLASQRTDVFDPTTGLAVSEEEAARRKRAAVAYAGRPGEARIPIPVPVAASAISMEEQLRHIREKAAGR